MKASDKRGTGIREGANQGDGTRLALSAGISVRTWSNELRHMWGSFWGRSGFECDFRLLGFPLMLPIV